MNSSSKPGPESKVTPDLVHRVSKLVAKGIPTRIALEGEPVTAAAYKKHLQRHPELAAIQAAAKIKFLDVTTDLIASKSNSMLRWLLEHRFAHVFCNSNDDEESDDASESAPQSKTQTLAGVPEHLVDELRKQASHA
jgi:hypothetical protein